MTLEDEWTKEFPGKPFPKAGEITQEVLDWANSVIGFKNDK